MSGFTTGMRTSITDQWATPQYLFDELDREFHFDLDVCADESNHKCARYFDRSVNGLSQEWTGTCWMNPPYGREIGKWVEKAKLSARGGGGCCLSAPRPYGHTLVEGPCDGGDGVALHPGARQVRGFGLRRTLPVGHSRVRHTEGPDHQPCTFRGGV